MPTGSHSPDLIPGKEMHVVKNNKDKDAALMKRSGSSPNLKRLMSKVLRSSSMKNLLFKSKKPKSPVEIVRETRALLIYVNSGADSGNSKREEKLKELDVHIGELKSILYGSDVSEPIAEACALLTQEFFREDTLRLLILSVLYLNLEARKYATQVVAILQRQPVRSRLVASDYLVANLDIVDKLITGYEDPVVALHYGVMLRECIRHQVVARYTLKSEHIKKFFNYIQLPNYDVASNAADTFKELMTRHKSTVAEFLTENYTWFFAEFNLKLLESTNYMTRRNAVKLVGDILLDRSNAGVMIRYVSSKSNMIVLMNLLRESHKRIQFDAFQVFKLFVVNQNKPAEIVNILYANKTKLLRFLEDFNTDKEDEIFETNKAQVIQEIEELQPKTPLATSGELQPRTPLNTSGELQPRTPLTISGELFKPIGL